MEKLMTETQVAELFGWTVAALRQRRYRQQPPKYLKIGGKSVRYRAEDIEDFVLAGQRRDEDGKRGRKRKNAA